MPAGGIEQLGRSVLTLDTDPARLRAGLSAARQESLSTLSGIQNGLKNAGRAISETGAKMTVGVTLPILAIGKAITSVGMDFETTLNQVVGLTDVTRDQIGGIRDDVVAMGKEIGKSPQELAEAFYFVASAGFNASEAMEVLRTAATASAAGLGSTQDIAKVLGLTINAYGRENITAARAADILVAAVKDGTAEADAFAGVLGRVVPTAATLGVAFDQVSAALAGMTLTGLSADEAATSLNQVLVSLLKPTSEAEEALDEMGLSAAGLRKELREQGLLATLRTLEERFAGNDEAASLVFGNVRALRGVLSLLALDSEQLNKVFADTAAAQGDLAEGYSETEGSAREMARAQAELDAALIELSTDVLPVVIDLLHAVAGAAGGAARWFKSLPPDVRETAVRFAAVAAVVGPLAVVLGSLLSAIGGLIGMLKTLALVAVPGAIGALTRLSVIAIWGILPAAGPALKAVGFGILATGQAAVTAAPQLAILGAALAAVLIVYQQVKAGVDAMAAGIGTDVANLVEEGNVAALAQAKRALETGLAELDALRVRAGRAPMFGPAFSLATGLLSDDARRQLESDLAVVNAALTEHGTAVEDTLDSYELFRGGLRTTAGATRSFAGDVKKVLDETLAAQRSFAAGMLDSIQKFRQDLEGAFSAAKNAELDMSDTLLAIAQKQEELATLDKETSRKIKNGTGVQSQEYRNRREHILAELSSLALHAALIGDGMHREAALTALLTSQDMADGLTSEFPETKAAYKQLQLDALAELQKLASQGGPASKAAAEAIAAYINPSNPLSPFRSAKAWGEAMARAYLAGIADEMHRGADQMPRILAPIVGAFKASSPPGPESPLHRIDVWGENTGSAWVGALVGSIRKAAGLVRSPLSQLGQSFDALVPRQLTLAAAVATSSAASVTTPPAAGAPAGLTIGDITISVDASGAKDPAAVGGAVRQGVADAMADILREQSQRFVAGRA